MYRYSTIAALAVALTTVGSVAYAANATENDALAITNAQTPLSQAVTADQVFDGNVDAQGGYVIAANEDGADRGGNDNAADRGERGDNDTGADRGDNDNGGDHENRD